MWDIDTPGIPEGPKTIKFIKQMMRPILSTIPWDQFLVMVAFNNLEGTVFWANHGFPRPNRCFPHLLNVVDVNEVFPPKMAEHIELVNDNVDKNPYYTWICLRCVFYFVP